MANSERGSAQMGQKMEQKKQRDNAAQHHQQGQHDGHPQQFSANQTQQGNKASGQHKANHSHAQAQQTQHKGGKH